VRDPNERLRDKLEAIAAIERHLDCDKAAFEQDELRQAWFLRHLQIIGEAARALPAGIRALATEIPWSKIIGIRNVLVHGYFGIDIVWLAVTNDAPALKPAILSLRTRNESRHDAARRLPPELSTGGSVSAGVVRSRRKHIHPGTIRADHRPLLDKEEHARMAERTVAAVAGHSTVIHLDGLGGHGQGGRLGHWGSCARFFVA
jgi:uncharacterized protein with HEPN domain